MNIDLTRKRDELADKRSKRQCTTGNQDLDKAIAWYLKIGFEDGFDAGFAEMQAQVDELKKEKLLKGYVHTNGMTIVDVIKLAEERDSLKQALDVAVNNILEIASTNADNPFWAKVVAQGALTSINEILNQTKQGE